MWRARPTERDDAPVSGAAGLIWRAVLRAGERALFADQDRWFLWAPALLALGAAFYFWLPFEPLGTLAGAVAMAGLGALLLLRHPRAFVVGLAIFCIAMGFALAKFRGAMVAAPVMPAASKSVQLSGWIEDTNGRGESRVRLLIRPYAISGLDRDELPYRVRVSAYNSAVSARAGDFVEVWATLSAPPAPVAPGAYDFARSAWFDRIGGTGYVTSKVAPTGSPGPRPLAIAFAARIEALRHEIGARIRTRLPDRSGAFAIALITGERGGIEKDAIAALRDAGLAHLLAISGLHMVLMAGSLFWILRCLLAAIPSLALSRPIKKWSAAFALMAALGYLVLSGAAVSTQRAFIMIAIMFIAILLDRPAITMRNVAVAALVIIIARPESVLDVGFQMSFATVIALIAAYENRNSWTGNPPRRSRYAILRGAGLATRYLGGIMLTTLIATLATAPIAAVHFNRVALYGLLGNLFALPVMGFMVMPAIGLTLVLMPFGLEAAALWPLGLGLDAVLWIAYRVSELPGAVAIVSTSPIAVVLAFVSGGLWLCLWRGRWRRAGAAIALPAFLLSFAGSHWQTTPDILIERDLKTIALRGEGDRLALLSGRSGKYSAERWLRMNGDDATVSDAADRNGFQCDPLGCAARLANGEWLAVIRHTAIIAEECARASVIITQIPIRTECRSARLIIDRGALKRGGSHALRIAGGGYQIETANGIRGARPWARVNTGE